MPTYNGVEFTPGQMTPQQAAAQATRVSGDAQVQVEPGTGKQFMLRGDGKKYYVPPDGGPDDKSGGGLFHGRQTWNAETGEYDQHLDTSKIMTWVAAGLITAGTANAFMSGAAPAAASSGAAAPSATAGGVLPSTGSLTVGSLPAGAAPTGMAGGAAIPGASSFGGGGTIARVATMADRGKNLLHDVGDSIGAATSAAGNTRRADADTNAGIHNSNSNAQAQYENELMNRAKTEADQRRRALQDVARASYVQNPNRSPFNPTPAPKFSESYLTALRNLDTQGSSKLSGGPQYDTNSMTPLAPLAPIDPTKASTLERVGNYAAPAASTIKSLWDMWGGN